MPQLDSLPAALVAAVRDAARALPGGVAAFDADGTLWREDVGEAFLRHLRDLGWVKLASGEDPYAAYEAAVDRDRATGYAYAAQLQAGLSREKVAAEAASFAARWVPSRLIASTQALLALCREAGLRTAIISASALEIVHAAAPLAGVSVAQSLGMTCAVAGGVITDRIVPPLTYAEGKVAAFARAGWGPLAVAGGDSLRGDLSLLSAARVAVVVAPEAGSPLSAEAVRRGWAVLPQ